MLVKEGQSILDFINYFPIQAVDVRTAPLSNKEAQALFDIWESGVDKFGNARLPESVDSYVVTSLITKGYIDSKKTVSANETKAVGITKKGREVIRNIILMTEQNIFDKQSSATINYEGIHKVLHSPKIASSWLDKITKTAQTQMDFSDSEVRRLDGYLAQVANHATDARGMLADMLDIETSSKIDDDSTQGFGLNDVIQKIRFHLQHIVQCGNYIQDVMRTGANNGNTTPVS